MSIDGQLLKTFFAGSKVEDLSWSRDGKTLLSSSVSINDKTIIKLWRIDGQLLKTFSIINENSEYIWHTLSPDGNILARTDINNYLTGISLWNKDGNLLKNWLGNANIIYVGSWSPDGKILAVGNKDAKIQFWSREGNLLKTLPSPINLNGGGFGSTTGAIFQLAWSPDGEVLAASGTDQTIQIWNRDGELIVNLPGHATYVNSLSWSKNINGQDFGRQRSGNYSYEDFTLVSSSNDGIINLWQFSDSEIGSGWGWKLFQTIKTTSGVITVDSSSDGKNLISLTNDGILHIWDMGGIALSTTEQVVRHTDEDKKKLEPNTLTTILSPNRKILASISVSDDFTTKVELQSLDKQSLHKDISAKSVNYGNSSISSVVWSPDSKTLAFLQDKILINTIYQEIVIWDIEGGTSKIIPLKRFIRKSNPKINWSPNSKTIYFDNGSQRLKFSLELNNLLINGCSWIHKYLKNNPSVEESDRHLCDDVKK
ncbi:hypothetical protein [Anabaena azotica]|uniref:WD40 repeat domain-containing protein n=1 Tax=Anabaena azotica TaxID=197653 RepID=UPI0039A4752B